MVSKDLNIKIRHLHKDINLYYSWESSTIYLRHGLGIVCIRFPSHYFSKMSVKSVYFLFTKSIWFNSFIKHVFTLYDQLYHYYYVKLKIRGLGYRIREVTQVIIIFFSIIQIIIIYIYQII